MRGERSWEGENGENFVVVTPQVANMTDDNGDGEIDLCDVPDVLVVAIPAFSEPGHIYLLDGETGALHRRFETAVAFSTTPALGDIDGDGFVEVVTTLADGHVGAFSHEGDLQWSAAALAAPVIVGALALADLDDHQGNVVQTLGPAVTYEASTLLERTLADSPALNATAAHHVDGESCGLLANHERQGAVTGSWQARG